MNLQRRFIRAFIVYTLDMLMAIAGWIYGFGMHVENWFALIGIMIGWRFAFHIFTTVFMHQDAQAMTRPAAASAENQDEFERRWRAVSVSLTGRGDSDKAEVMRCLDGVLEAYMDKVCADHIAKSAGGQHD